MKHIHLIFLAVWLAGCSLAPSTDTVFNPDYFNDQPPEFQSSQLTTIYKSSAFKPDVTVGEFKYTFADNTKSIYWLGYTEPHNRPYDLTAVWIDPQEQIYFQQRAERKGQLLYMSAVKLKKKKDQAQIGQWRLEIRGPAGQVLAQNRFYIGAPLQVTDIKLEEIWTDPRYDISQAQGIVLQHDVQVTVDKDFKTTRRVYKKIKVLKDEGKSLAEVYEPYVDRHETLLFGFAQTILPGGKIVPQSQPLYGTLLNVPPHYISSKVIVLNFPDVAKDALIEYELTFNSSRPFTPGMFYDEMLLAEPVPVALANYSVTLPAGIDLKYSNFRQESEPVIRELPDSGQRVYSWTFRQIPPISVETVMPPYRDSGAALVVSTTSDWETVGAWWRELTHLKYKKSEAMDEALEKFKKDNPAPSLLVDRIYRYVKEQIVFNGFDFGRTDYEPSIAADILKNKSGDSKDMAVLLKTFFDNAGIQSHIGLVRTRRQGPVAAGVSGAGEFNHVMVVAFDQNGARYLDPSKPYNVKEVLPPDDYGADILLIKDDGVELTKVPAAMPAENGITFDVVATMDQSYQVTGTVTVQFSGVADGIFKSEFAQLQKNEFQHYIQQMLNRLYPAAKFEECKISNQTEHKKKARLEISFKMDQWLTSTDGRYYLKLIGDGTIFPEYVFKTRANPLFLDLAGFLKTTVSLSLPDNLVVDELPKGQSFDSELLQFHTRYEMAGRSAIRMENYIAEKKMAVSKEEFPLFLKYYEDYAAGLQTPVILVPVPQPSDFMLPK